MISTHAIGLECQTKDFLKSIDEEDLIANFIPEAEKQLEKDWRDQTKTIVHKLETEISDLQHQLSQANSRINHLENEVESMHLHPCSFLVLPFRIT